MLEDGTALSYLEQTCPRQHFAVCADLNELKSYNSLHPYPQAYPQNTLFNYFLSKVLSRDWADLPERKQKLVR